MVNKVSDLSADEKKTIIAKFEEAKDKVGFRNAVDLLNQKLGIDAKIEHAKDGELSVQDLDKEIEQARKNRRASEPAPVPAQSQPPAATAPATPAPNTVPAAPA